MPRQARERSKSGIYHLMLRGINKQTIFEDNEDRQKIIEAMGYYKMISNCTLRKIKAMPGVSIRQLSRITGISKSVIDRA